MNDELRELGRTLVGISTMPKKEFCEVTELIDGEIGCKRGLFAFLPDDPHSCRACAFSHHRRNA